MRPKDWGWRFEGKECAEGRFCRARRPTKVPSRARAPARLGRGPGVRRKTARPALFRLVGEFGLVRPGGTMGSAPPGRRENKKEAEASL